MFNGIKLPHRTSTRPADQQPLLPKRQGHGTPAPSSHVHPELTGRGSPGGSAGAMAPRGNPFLKRSDALSPQAQANAHAAYQGPRVRFAAVDPGGRIAAVEAAEGPGPWRRLAPEDGIEDGDRESYTVELPASGSLRLRVTDAAGNLGGAEAASR